MVVVAFIYILYLTIDIHLYKKRKEKFESQLEEQRENGFNLQETTNGLYQIDIEVPASMGKSIKHNYCFNKDRHSTNFFIKVGAVGEFDFLLDSKKILVLFIYRSMAGIQFFLYLL